MCSTTSTLCSASSPAEAVSDALGGSGARTPTAEVPQGTLHRAECECLVLRRQLATGQQMLRPTAALAERMDAAIRPHTVGQNTQVYATKLIVFTRDRPGARPALPAPRSACAPALPTRAHTCPRPTSNIVI